MRADTRSVALDAPAEMVFDFLADPLNLPKWAVAFAHSVHRDGDAWRVQTGQGEIGLQISSDAAHGTIDFRMRPASGVLITAYSRVLASGDTAEYVFTQFQGPSMSDAAFEGQVHALCEELTVLKSIMKARAVCPN